MTTIEYGKWLRTTNETECNKVHQLLKRQSDDAEPIVRTVTTREEFIQRILMSLMILIPAMLKT
jgi:hypothetical protein